MPEPDPFASPFHAVDLPGQPSGPVPAGFAGYPMPMPEIHGGFAPPRPAALTVAFWCWLAGTLLVVVLLPAVFLTDVDAFAEDLYQRSLNTPDPNTREEAAIGATLTPVLFGFGFAVPAVLFVIAAFKMRAGRHWARVLLAVLGAFAVLFGLFMVIGFTSGALAYVNWVLGTVWALVFLASVMLGIVAMFLPPSNDYVRWANPR